jgi:hypothetical protein
MKNTTMIDATAWNTDCTEAYLKTPQESERNGTPFIDDSHLFIDSDPDMIALDGFETIPTTVYIRRPYVKMSFKAVPFDPEYTIINRLETARPVDFSRELDVTAAIDARCTNNGLDRMIIEQCTWTGNTIQIPQLIAPGLHNIPGHLNIERIRQFSPTIKTFAQAKIMAGVLSALDLNFQNWTLRKIHKAGTKASFAQRVNQWAKKTNKAPWYAPVGAKAMPLIDIANALDDLERQPQDDQIGYEIDEDAARLFPVHWKEPDREPDHEQKNTVGLHTYLKLSRIPSGKEYTNGKFGIPGRKFKAIMNGMDTATPGEELAHIWKDQEKRFSFEQRDAFLAAWKRQANAKVREEYTGPITQCPPALEPRPDTEPEVLQDHENMALTDQGELENLQAYFQDVMNA